MRIRERFNPRAPCGARLPATTTSSVVHALFQPTRPLRGATRDGGRQWAQVPISTHAPLAGRDLLPVPNPRLCMISTHAPLAGRDSPKADPSKQSSGYFNPRAPCGARRTFGNVLRRLSDFNPRAPCGARLVDDDEYIGGRLFQPTRPLRGATASERKASGVVPNFNPRAPCGARRTKYSPPRASRYFNPRAPCGARLAGYDALSARNRISTHAPLAGRDVCGGDRGAAGLGISTHAPLAGRDSA